MRWSVAIALLASSCLDVVEHGTPTALTVVTTDCAAASVIEGATKLILVVHEETRVLFTRTVPVTAIPVGIGLPAATHARLRVTAVDDAGRIVARGTSLEFEVGVSSVTVELFPVDRFARLCTSLGQARAFHTATPLRDGRVLFVGGMGHSGEPMSSMEVLGSGAVSDAGPLEITAQGNRYPLPRAHHAALLTDSGQLFISGGEVHAIPLGTSMVVDPEMGFASGALRASARSRHAVFKVGSAVFLLGGTTVQGAQVVVPDALIERLELSTMQMTTVATLPAPRLEAAVTLFDLAAIFAGGVDGAGASADVRRVNVDSPLIHPLLQLHTARRSATAIVLGPRVLVLGGFGQDGAALGSTEWLELGGERFPPGPSITPRASACAVPLPGFRALVMGGVDANGPSAAAEVIDSTGTATPLTFPGVPRQGHACTVLDDGSVLVSGGLDAAGKPLDELWRYTPSAS